MNTRLQRNIAPLIACLALGAIPSASHADDGGGDYNFPASNVVYEPASPQSPTCAQAAQATWFARQVEISDGDVTPAAALPTECDRTNVAQADDDTK